MDRQEGGRDRPAWGRLDQRDRGEVAAGSVEQFGEDQQAAIRAYLRRIQEER
jgi:hypothetical protein